MNVLINVHDKAFCWMDFASSISRALEEDEVALIDIIKHFCGDNLAVKPVGCLLMKFTNLHRIAKFLTISINFYAKFSRDELSAMTFLLTS